MLLYVALLCCTLYSHVQPFIFDSHLLGFLHHGNVRSNFRNILANQSKKRVVPNLQALFCVCTKHASHFSLLNLEMFLKTARFEMAQADGFDLKLEAMRYQEGSLVSKILSSTFCCICNMFITPVFV